MLSVSVMTCQVEQSSRNGLTLNVGTEAPWSPFEGPFIFLLYRQEGLPGVARGSGMELRPLDLHGFCKAGDSEPPSVKVTTGSDLP